MYWRLLTTNPTAARDIVLSEKPVISTETDRMDKGMLDQLLLHTGTLGSIYHKVPSVSREFWYCLRKLISSPSSVPLDRDTFQTRPRSTHHPVGI
jgi:hypothetical protein